MKALTLSLLLLLPGCGPKVCAPAPTPDGWEGAVEFLPKSAVVCGIERDGLLVNFPTRDVKRLGLETVARLRAGGWDTDHGTDAESGNIHAERSGTSVTVYVSDQNGGPFAGHVTGLVYAVDRKGKKTTIPTE